MKQVETALSRVPANINILTLKERKGEIETLRQTQFSKYPEGGDAIDIFDDEACILGSDNQNGKLVSTVRIIFDDGESLLPADKYVKPELDSLRQQGLKIAELSKFAIASGVKGILQSYLWAYYEIGVEKGIDSFISINPAKDAKLYKTIVAAKELSSDIGYSYGTNNRFVLLEFKIEQVKSSLSKWLGEELS